MITLPNGSTFCITGPLWGESTGQRWVPLIKASDAEIWCLIWSAPQQRLSKQSRCRWFETPCRSFWYDCNEVRLRNRLKIQSLISRHRDTVFHVIAPLLVRGPDRPHVYHPITTLIARFMGPTWGSSGADRNRVGTMLVPWTLLSGYT